MAFYELCIREGKSPFNSQDIMNALRNVQDRLSVAAGQISSGPRQLNIAVVKGLIQNFFQVAQPPAAQHGAGLVIRLENALRRSRIETSAFECKQGRVKLDPQRTEDPDLLNKLVQTLCGIANIGPASQGALFIGVADNANDKDRIQQFDNIRALEVGNRFVVGVSRELAILNINLERYKRQIVDHIRSSSLSEPLRSTVLSTIDCIEYRGLSVICIWVPQQHAVSHVGDVVFVRQGSSTIRIEGFTASQSVIQRFA